ncbi:hypothetical protein KDK_22530 [Dictyobacter kobayashii]|uniref:Uncharacterized protein n=1 Tax=Dictyobacter kobayashii TaxID=2014872 RepID=A0A402AHC5_9CHLR|nr:hypothetical protein KDK_22530 [Dictyobacter kobayashii]
MASLGAEGVREDRGEREDELLFFPPLAPASCRLREACLDAPPLPLLREPCFGDDEFERCSTRCELIEPCPPTARLARE